MEAGSHTCGVWERESANWSRDMKPDHWGRAQHLGLLLSRRHYDVVVVGGGILGSGAALDLAARGLSVALIDRSDFASGTSSKSTKLLHGGIRYLPHLEFGLVRDGLREQKVLAHNADFLFKPIEFMVPLYNGERLFDVPPWLGKGVLRPSALRLGLMTYDLLGGRGRPVPRRRHWSGDEVSRLHPRLRTDGLEEAFSFGDAQIDDARLVLSILKTAVRHHDLVAVPRVGLERAVEAEGVWKLRARDLLGDAGAIELSATCVLEAIGPSEGGFLSTQKQTYMMRSRGSHVVIRAHDLGMGSEALVLPDTEDGRLLFVIPWEGEVLVGTTDVAVAGESHSSGAPQDEVDFLLRHLSKYFDVEGVAPLSSFAGMRVLHPAGESGRASRRHLLQEPLPGYFRLTGGKLSSYRVSAIHVADRMARRLGSNRESVTDTIRLVGSGVDSTEEIARLVEVGVTANAAQGLIGRYGTEARDVMDLAATDEAIDEAIGMLPRAEARYAAKFESATTISDVALRRTRISLLTPDHGRSIAPQIVAGLAEELGWGDAAKAEELARFEQDLAREGL